MTASDHPRALRGSALPGRAFDDYESWQRSDLGREYYDRRTARPMDNRAGRVVPGSAGRTITVLGMIIALAGAAGWLWLVLAFVSAVGAGTIADHPLRTEVSGIPLGPGGLVAILLGSALAVVGNGLAKAARRRYERARQDPTRPF